MLREIESGLSSANSRATRKEGPSSVDKKRKELVISWANAPEEVQDYEAGEITEKGNDYNYPKGHRLIIGGEQVMDSCETPWAFETVNKAFNEFPQDSGPLSVLERGFGMGITARRVIQRLITLGGEYKVIELNKGNANYAREWIKKQKIALTNLASSLPGTKPDIDISIIEGDAYEETAKLAEKGEKFDIIISDTYPLSEDEQGINDLRDLDTLKRCLKPNGVFTFFAYFPGSAGGVVKKQENMITPHFKDYSVSSVEITPPPDYEYLRSDAGPVKRLTVVICKKPIL
jgi:SAM-dependent methyltransferase